MPISSRKSRNAASFSGSGESCTRYMQACCREFQLLGGGDIGEDHEFLDQPVAVEPGARDDGNRAPVAVEHDLVLGQVELQRATRSPRAVERGKRAVKCRQPSAASGNGPSAMPSCAACTES